MTKTRRRYEHRVGELGERLDTGTVDTTSRVELALEVWTGRGLVTHYLLFVISLSDRVVQIAGITTRPDEAWMLQVVRNLVDAETGVLRERWYLLLDRGRHPVNDSGTSVIRALPLSPNLNATERGAAQPIV